MKEIDEMNEIRREQFSRYLDSCQSQAAVAAKLDLSPGYINQLKTGHRPITEKTALKLEKKLGLAPGYFSGNRSLNKEQSDVLEAMEIVKEAIKGKEHLITAQEKNRLYSIAIDLALDGKGSREVIDAYLAKYA